MPVRGRSSKVRCRPGEGIPRTGERSLSYRPRARRWRRHGLGQRPNGGLRPPEQRVHDVSDILVVKIGGSTLGSGDTAIQDIAELHRRGYWPVVVHGGGAIISDWLKRFGFPTRFEEGLRVTDADALEVVVAVLAGLVNKQLVASLQAVGVPAVGLSCADGGVLHLPLAHQPLGPVGENPEPH